MTIQIVDLQPTVFFVRQETGLRHLVKVVIQSSVKAKAGLLTLQSDEFNEQLPVHEISIGTSEHELFFPDIRSAMTLRLTLTTPEAEAAIKQVTWTPQKHWEVYLVHYSHHDLGYTDLPSDTMDEHVLFLDQVLEFCEETEHWPDDAQFRFLIEQAYSIVNYVEKRPKEKVERLMHFVRNGQLEVTALYANMTLELCGHEELVRLLYPSYQLKREYGFEISTAEHNDIPGFSWGLVTVLTDAGVKYFAPGIPRWYWGREPQDRVHPMWDETEVLPMETPGAFRWEGPTGQQILVWYDLHGGEWQPTSYAHAERDLPGILGKINEQECPYDMTSYTIRGGHRDNAPPSMRTSYIAKEWNGRWAYPRLVSSTHQQFLKDFEARWGDSLTVLRGELPGTDYPVGAASTPHETALNRNAHDWLLAAEKWSTIASIVSDYPYPKRRIDEAYRNTILFDEHCWGLEEIGGPGQAAAWSQKSGFAYRAAALAHDLMIKSANKIVDEIALEDDAYHVTIFNHLATERSEVVRVAALEWSPASMVMHWQSPTVAGEGARYRAGTVLGRGIVTPPLELLMQPFELVDIEQQISVPYQLVETVDPQTPRPYAAERFALGQIEHLYKIELVFVADGLPALGAKTYKIVPCSQWPDFANAMPSDQNGIENQYYRLRFDTQKGTVTELYDKELGHSLLDENAPHHLGQLITRESRTAQEQAGRTTSAEVIEQGPIYSTLRIKGENVGCPRWTQDIVVYHMIKRIDVNTLVLRDSTPMLEVFVAFPFQVEKPSFRYEASGSVIEPTRDQLPGSNTDYYAVQHWADVFNDKWGITWSPIDAPMTEFGGLWPGYVSAAHHGVTSPEYGHPFLGPGSLTKSHLYSLAIYNNFRTNFYNVRPAETLLRYSFRSHGGDWHQGEGHHFGWSVSNPPLAVWMQGPKPGQIPPRVSFCQVSEANVLLLTFKRAEDGNGFIIRLMETEGVDTSCQVTLPNLTLRQAFSTTVVEENQTLLPCSAHSVEIELKPYAIVTLRLHI